MFIALGIISTIALGIILTLIFDNEWAWVIAFIPYNVYVFMDWRSRNKPKDRKEMYQTVGFLLLLPVLIAITMFALRS